VEVEVHLFANLADYGPPGRHQGAVRVEVPEGASLHDLMERLRIPDELPRLLLVNGREAEPTVRLRPGDVVDVLPPLVGGSDVCSIRLDSARRSRAVIHSIYSIFRAGSA
jgi:molybdopterin synthase sulfur carrier subunit